MFITAVCLFILLKLKWPNDKSAYVSLFCNCFSRISKRKRLFIPSLLYYVPSCHFSLVVIVYTKRRKIYSSKFIMIREFRAMKELWEATYKTMVPGNILLPPPPHPHSFMQTSTEKTCIWTIRSNISERNRAENFIL